MIKIFRYIFILGLIVLLTISCSIQRNKLFKIPKGEEYTFDTLPEPPYPDYKIAIDDKITFSVQANNGEKLFLGGQNQNSLGTGDFVIRKDGFTYIPLLGEVNLLGKTVKECENILTKELSKYINDPYIKLTVSNSRVILFKGNGSSASIIQLNNAKTTLLEVIAQSGGISERAKSKNIKIVRTVNGVRKIFIVDLSTIDKISTGEMIVQANDYIFIEDVPNYPVEIMKEITPYLTVLSFTVSTFSLYKIIFK